MGGPAPTRRLTVRAKPARADDAPSKPGSAARVSRNFFAQNIAATVLGVVTGVVAARTLQPTGRGELAAILVPLGLVPLVLSVGLPTFASRHAARGGRTDDTLGTVGALALMFGVAGVLPYLFLAPALADGNGKIHGMLTAAAVLLPFTLVSAVAADMVLGYQRWRPLLIQRIVPPAGTAIGYLALVATGNFNVLSAAICALAFGVLATIPIWTALRPIGRVRFRPDLARRAMLFGVKAWPVTLSQILNHRLDQVMMVRAVSPSQLGLYAVAVTVTGGTTLIASAIGTATYPRVAAGSDVLVPRTVRVTVGVCLVTAVIGCVASPLLVPAVFGDAFRPAVPLAVILFAASVPLAGAAVLASCLAGGDRAGAAGLAEVVACMITVGGLLVLLPPFGAAGAAYVSLGAYSINFFWLLVVARSRFGGTIRAYCVPTVADALLVVSMLRPNLRRT